MPRLDWSEPALAPQSSRLSPAAAAPARSATILSVATELPAERLTSAELAATLGISEDWILSRTGIRERRRAARGERLADYAACAGARALERAAVAAVDLDLVLVATMTQDELTPNTAPLVAHALGARRAGALDIGAACTAFLSGRAIPARSARSCSAPTVRTERRSSRPTRSASFTWTAPKCFETRLLG